MYQNWKEIHTTLFILGKFLFKNSRVSEDSLTNVCIRPHILFYHIITDYKSAQQQN